MCLDEGEREERKSWLLNQHSKNEDFGIQSHHFMANRWNKVEAVRDFIFLGSKITADSDCSHEIKRRLFLGRKAMTNLAAKLLQSCPNLCDPIDGSPPGSSVHGIFQARVLEWGAIAFSV